MKIVLVVSKSFLPLHSLTETTGRLKREVLKVLKSLLGAGFAGLFEEKNLKINLENRKTLSTFALPYGNEVNEKETISS